MASFIGKVLSLFGFGGAARPEEQALAAATSVEYNGFTIRAEPYKEQGQYQTAGVIAQEIDGVLKEHRFVRADRYASLEDAVSFALLKGRQIIDEQARMGSGRGLFER